MPRTCIPIHFPLTRNIGPPFTFYQMSIIQNMFPTKKEVLFFPVSSLQIHKTLAENGALEIDTLFVTDGRRRYKRSRIRPIFKKYNYRSRILYSKFTGKSKSRIYQQLHANAFVHDVAVLGLPGVERHHRGAHVPRHLELLCAAVDADCPIMPGTIKTCYEEESPSAP